MKHFLLLVKALFLLNCAFSQTDTTSYFFKEVGMSIMVPSKFLTVESFEDEKLRIKGKRLIEDASNLNLIKHKTRSI